MSNRNFENQRWRKGQTLEFRHHAARSLVGEDSVLDVGCGDGTLMALLREDGIAVEGIDLSDAAVAVCNEKGLAATRVSLGEEPLPFADHSFPCVIALDVLEHTYVPDDILVELTRVSSGALIIGVPNFSSLPARIQVLCGEIPENNRPHKGHVYWFNWNILKQLAERHNLTLESVCVNAPLERTPLRPLMRVCARIWPNLFALSFVVRFKVSSAA